MFKKVIDLEIVINSSQTPGFSRLVAIAVFAPRPGAFANNLVSEIIPSILYI